MIMANDNNIQPVADDSQIVLYQPMIALGWR